ncbi:acyltransferase [Luteibacter aegosomatis]|uniref:acyltransferase family protein n=1 Tax=Luteibacter aegosomatis TaxID=2911537 RepID=UPI001FFBE65C|nr:acyltransferase [Luteibacter aegosomatis]UPG86533.1 acyltransferase [Luteibacter aegosomatis]
MGRSISVAEGLAKREDNFLLLRVVAAVLVIYGHSFYLAPHGSAKEVFTASGWGIYSGAIAVDMFFVISGFMVAGSFIRQPDLWEFMKARLLRILPGYLACLLIISMVMGALFTSLPLKEYFRDPDVWAYVRKNLHFSSDMRFSLPGVFATHPHDAVNGSLWTLPAEFRMYVFVAVLGSLGILARRWLVASVILGLLITGICCPWNLPLHPDWIRLGGYFSLGILIFTFKDEIRISSAGLLSAIFAVYLCRGLDAYGFVFAIALCYFCFWFAYIPRLPRMDAWGDPSYAIYLWGWPIQQMFVHFFPELPSLANFALSSCTAIIFGYLSWYLIEKPCLRLKHVFSRKSPVVAR